MCVYHLDIKRMRDELKDEEKVRDSAFSNMLL